MKYHAWLEYDSASHYFWNHSEQSLLDNVVVPFVNGQIITLKSLTKGPRLFNMKSATTLRLYKTRSSIRVTDDKTVPQQIRADDFRKNDCTAELLGKVQSQGTPRITSSLIQKALQEPLNQIFVVMKFGDEELDSAYTGAYKAVAKEYGLNCIRVDEIEDSGKISDQILEKIAESKYVICDLTGSRPNCYYETGFAHALGKQVILLIKKGEAIHFDLAGHRFITWGTEEELRKKLRSRLGALEEQDNTNERSTPVEEN